MTRRALVVLSLVLAAGAACSSNSSSSAQQPSTSSAAPEPTLGRPWTTPSAVGFGDVRPQRVYNGGDPTGDFSAIVWSDWGGAQAHGSGTGYYEPPNAIVADSVEAPVNLVAYDLAVCDGVPAYRHLAAYFPTYGQQLDPTMNGEVQYDVCTGL